MRDLSDKTKITRTKKNHPSDCCYFAEPHVDVTETVSGPTFWRSYSMLHDCGVDTIVYHWARTKLIATVCA